MLTFPAGFVFSSEVAESALINDEIRQIQALAGKTVTSLSVLADRESLPPGCAVFPVTSNTTAYIDVGSHVDVSSLLDKTETKLAKATDAAARQKKLMGAEGWSDKVSDALKEAEVEKLAVFEAQIGSLTSSIEQFKRLKLDS